MTPVKGIDELRVNPYSVTGTLNAAFEHIANAQLLGNLCDFCRSTLVSE
jgi:hypothetical protein